MVKTYTRQRPRAYDDFPSNDGPRKRIKMSATGAAVEEVLPSASAITEVSSVIISQPKQQSDRETSSVSVPSSPASTSVKLFSDDAQQDSDSGLSSAPDTPEKALPLPSLASRKPAFAFLKRKRAAFGNQRSKMGGKRPLGEIDVNASNKPKLGRGKSFTQMQIDLGEELQKECNVCGMEYVPSNSEDAALHKEYHDLNVLGVDMGKIFTKDVGVKAVYTAPKLLREEEMVVAVDKESLPRTRTRVKRILELVNAELSATDIDEDKLWSSIRPAAEPCRDLRKGTKDQQAADDGGVRFKAFLLLSGDKCIAFCLAQKIKTAHAVVKSPSSDDDPSINPTSRSSARTLPILADSSSPSSSISVSCTPSVALLGISRIWTSRKYRGRGLAPMLLDCARSNFFYGIEVPKELVAFSQPTESGGKLARRWFGREEGWSLFQEE